MIKGKLVGYATIVPSPDVRELLVNPNYKLTDNWAESRADDFKKDMVSLGISCSLEDRVRQQIPRLVGEFNVEEYTLGQDFLLKAGKTRNAKKIAKIFDGTGCLVYTLMPLTEEGKNLPRITGEIEVLDGYDNNTYALFLEEREPNANVLEDSGEIKKGEFLKYSHLVFPLTARYVGKGIEKLKV